MRWIEVAGRERNVKATSVPLDLAPILREDLFARVKTAVVTSATLATDHGFEFVARRLGAPTPVILRMGLNILVDAVLGAVPFLGDLFDVTWKANRKNVQVLEEFIATPQRAQRSSMAVVAATAVVVLGTLVGIAAGTVWLISRIF